MKHNSKKWIACLLVCIGVVTALLGVAGCQSQKNPPAMNISSTYSVSGDHVSLVDTILTDSSMPEDATSQLQNALRGKVVILDPGHGFGDVGCPIPGEGVYEKDMTPILVSKIRACLEADGVTVLQTHDGTVMPTVSELNTLSSSLSYDLDGYLSRLVAQYSGRTGTAQANTVTTFKDGIIENQLFSIFERSWYANLLSARQHASLFVSVHVNANEYSSELSGVELYSCSDTPYASNSVVVMQALEAGLRRAFPQSSVRKTAYNWDEAFAVNKYPDMPSVLIESGYATNPTDKANLLNEEWQNRFARAVANGIEVFLLG